MNPKREISSLQNATLPINRQSFKLIGIDPTTSKGALATPAQLPFAVTSGNLVISHLTQSAYDALTPDVNTIYVVDNGAKIYLGARELELVSPLTDFLLPINRTYIDTGFDLMPNSDAFSLVIQPTGAQAARQFSNIIASRTTAIGATANTDTTQFSFNLDWEGSTFLCAFGKDANNNILVGIVVVSGVNPPTTPIAVDIGEPESYNNVNTTLGAVTMPSGGALTRLGGLLPDDTRYIQIDGTGFGAASVSFDDVTQLFALPSVSAGTIANNTNSVEVFYNSGDNFRMAWEQDGNNRQLLVGSSSSLTIPSGIILTTSVLI